MNFGSYESIASEYYELRHITSRNFDAAASDYFRRADCDIPRAGSVLDLGAGRGTAARYCGVPTSRIIQVDIALPMLRLEPREGSAARIQADALVLPFKAQSFCAVTAFLFDPFNYPSLYREVSRVLRLGGRFVGTLPHPVWGFTLRNLRGHGVYRSRFFNRAGEIVERRSILMTQNDIAELLANAAFRDVRIDTIYLPADNGSVSPDIVDPAHRLGVTPYELQILFVIWATKC